MRTLRSTVTTAGALASALIVSLVAACGSAPGGQGSKATEKSPIPEHAESCVVTLGPGDHPDQTPTDHAISVELCKKLGGPSQGIWYVSAEKDGLQVMVDNATFRSLQDRSKNGTPLQKTELNEWAKNIGHAFQLESQQQDVRMVALGGTPLQCLYSGMFVRGEFVVVGCASDAKQ